MNEELRERLEKLREDVDRWWGNVNYYRDSMSQDGHNHEARKLLAEAVRVGVFSPAASEGVGEREADAWAPHDVSGMLRRNAACGLSRDQKYPTDLPVYFGTPPSHPAPEPERDEWPGDIETAVADCWKLAGEIDAWVNGEPTLPDGRPNLTDSDVVKRAAALLQRLPASREAEREIAAFRRKLIDRSHAWRVARDAVINRARDLVAEHEAGTPISDPVRLAGALRELDRLARHPEASPNAETLAHCGHPLDAIESGDEGTSYCRMCEEKAVVEASPTEREAT